MHGRLRARSGALVARRHPARLQRQAPGARHGRASSRSWKARSGASRRWPTRGVNRVINGPEAFTPGQRVHPRRIGGRWVLRGRRVLGPRHRRRGRDRPPGGVTGSSTASPSSTSGRWTSGGSGRPIAASRTRWRGRSRTTRPTTTSTTRTRSARPVGRFGWRRPTRSSRSWARRSARSPAGSARTGSSRTPPTATRPCDLEAGRASTGRRRSAPRRWRRGERPACSTRPRSPSSRSSGRARSRSSSRCAPTTWTCRSAGSSTRSC